MKSERVSECMLPVTVN